MSQTEYSYFRLELSATQPPKTVRWNVVAKEGDILLGHIGWFGRWRCYAFFPADKTVFEQKCLMELAAVCTAATKEHRDISKQQRQRIAP